MAKKKKPAKSAARVLADKRKTQAHKNKNVFKSSKGKFKTVAEMIKAGKPRKTKPKKNSTD